MSLLGSMIGLLIAAALAGDAAARDAQTRMDPLLYTAPVSKSRYLGGRFLAAFVLYAVILLAVPLGLAARRIRAEAGRAPWPVPSGRVSCALYLFLLLPNAFVATPLMFSMAALSRRAIVSYLGGAASHRRVRVQLGVVARAWGSGSWRSCWIPSAPLCCDELSMVWTPVERSTV